MFFHFNKDSMTFDLSFDDSHWLESFIATQIFTDKKDSENSATGWWAESIEGCEVGSELHKMKRNKLTDENIEIATQSVLNSLKYIQSQKAITQFDVLPESQQSSLLLEVQVQPANEPRMVNFGFRLRLD